MSTKLNRSHVITGETALILPTLGRTERDVQATGEQFVTVEDSMSVVHSSRGSKDPAADTLRSEVAIVSGSPGHCSARSIRCAGKCLPRTTT